jgi:lipoic acid synthetase
MAIRPDWLRVRAPTPAQAAGIRAVRAVLSRHGLHTVCQEALCPNAVECWGARTATFMILGNVCTRSCRFCGVPTGDPGGRVDESEPRRLADAIVELGLKYVVLTSVDRDDLEDGGAELFAKSVELVKQAKPDVRVETLIPDFSGDPRALNRVLSSGADVFGHNLETVRSLSAELRDRRASYEQSLTILGYLRASEKRRDARVKSGLMVGLGETRGDIQRTFADLREVGVDTLTIGQYLRPSAQATPVVRFIPPEEFDELASEARDHGFRSVVAGPLVRSSYHASEAYEEGCD